jgi:hypothetical protein
VLYTFLRDEIGLAQRLAQDTLGVEPKMFFIAARALSTTIDFAWAINFLKG